MAVTRKISTMIRSIVFFLLLGHVLSFFPFTKTTESNVETVLTGVRGVPEYLQSKYEKETFTCDGGTKTYSKDEINDSFCDCSDGSDEPGTSACAGNIFSCANKGYRIIQIPSSRVDDGTLQCGSWNEIVTSLVIAIPNI